MASLSLILLLSFCSGRLQVRTLAFADVHLQAAKKVTSEKHQKVCVETPSPFIHFFNIHIYKYADLRRCNQVKTTPHNINEWNHFQQS